jgi:hypothetical protein
MATKDEPVSSKVVLSNRSQFVEWFGDYKWHATSRGIWDICDPSAGDALNLFTYTPEINPTVLELLEVESARRRMARQQWDETPEGERVGARPTSSEPTFNDVREDHNARYQDYRSALSNYNIKVVRYTHMFNWVNDSVSKDLLRPIKLKLMNSMLDTSLQEIVRELKHQLAPTDTTSEAIARKEYRDVLARARQGRVGQLTWYNSWRNALMNARIYKVAEVEGTMAITDFLEAVGTKLAPDWASRQLADVFTAQELGESVKTLDEFGRIYAALSHESSLRANQKGIAPSFFATLGESSDPTKVPSSDNTKHACPCSKRREQLHRWEPTDCARLEFAITGSCDRKLRIEPSDQESQQIKDRLSSPRWKWIIEKKNWEKHFAKRATLGDSSEPKYPGKISAALMDPLLISESMGGVYATLNSNKHPLSSSTLLDNCGAMHLVNSKELLEPGTFRKARPDEVVECGSSALPILGFGKRVIKGAFDGPRGAGTEDLELSDVAVVEGFHVNIVSEARLLKAGVWYNGLDCSLKYGTEGESITMMKLQRRFNLVFIQFKALSTYLSVPSHIPTSAGGIIMYPTMERTVRKVYRRSRQPLKPRRDTEDVWHARAGHLGPRALRALVHAARNVAIEGIPRLQCEHCATAHAANVVSRRAPERKSPRPYYRCAWDLFDFPEGYNGMSWMLVIKEEYSGKLHGSPLKSKSLINVFGEIKRFERWVKRQYGLSICILKHDNERAVIAINGESAYELWAAEEGITIKTSPTYTHEPNGASERAGQEVITRSIKMRTAARLPEKLWPECAEAAIWLYNISPSEVRDLRTPNEVLDSWFRNYFRWYDPALITKLTVDLRPDWNGIYVYGARAYPVMKEREAGKNKRAYKVQPRAHIGYLVGYSASNIYRVWVPQLDEVIVTRNVTFDESTLYSPAREKLEGQPVEIARLVIEAIGEDEVTQDAGSIIEHLRPEDDAPVEHTEESTTTLGGGELMSTARESQNSGVSSGKYGLLSPEPTPEPVSQKSGSGSIGGDVRSALANRDEACLDDARLSEIVSTEGQAPPIRDERPSAGGKKVPQVIIYQKRDPPGLAQDQSSRGIEIDTLSSSSMRTVSNKSTREPEEGTAARHVSRSREKGVKGTRRSRRGKSPEYGKIEGGSVFNVISPDKLGSSKDQLNEFSGTFWPDHPDTQNQEHLFRTVHAVIAASVLANRTMRLGAISSLPHVHQKDLPKAPRNWYELGKHRYGDHFKKDAELEIQNLEQRSCWRQIPITQATTGLIPLKWHFQYRTDADGYLIRCRSRIVVRGDLQEDETITSTYAATLAARSFRTAMALAAYFDLEIKQFDVVNAFINAERDKSRPAVACKLPDGFKALGMCVEIDRALYGMKDSPALWYQEWATTLRKLNLESCKEEPCIFMNERRNIMVVFYVDDFCVLYHRDHEPEAQVLIRELNNMYELHKLDDLKWFLGIRVIRDRAKRKIWLVHDSYIAKIATKFKLDNWKCPSTPLPGTLLEKREGAPAQPAFVKQYQEKVGSVLYTAIMIRPDVAFAAAQLSQYLTNPSSEHMAAVDWTIAYLWGTRFLAIEYGGTSNECQLVIASDASFGDHIETRRSSHGYTIALFGGLIDWKAARLPTVSTSTTEAELLGVDHTARETIALQRFFRELRLKLEAPWTIFCDNQQTIRLIVGENERIATRLRHVDIKNMWLREQYRNGSFEVEYLPTSSMPADGMTKNLPRYKFEHFRALLNLQDIRGKIENVE